MKVLMAFGSLLACFVCLAGCGGSAGEQADVYPVSGTVTMGGAPLVGATVSFAPANPESADEQPVAYGRTNNQGEFALSTYGSNDGAAAGDYAVVITKYAASSSKSEAGAAHGPGAFASSHSAGGAESSGSVIPPQYSSSETTPLNESVTPEGENVFKFEIH